MLSISFIAHCSEYRKWASFFGPNLVHRMYSSAVSRFNSVWALTQVNSLPCHFECLWLALEWDTWSPDDERTYIWHNSILVCHCSHESFVFYLQSSAGLVPTQAERAMLWFIRIMFFPGPMREACQRSACVDRCALTIDIDTHDDFQAFNFKNALRSALLLLPEYKWHPEMWHNEIAKIQINRLTRMKLDCSLDTAECF